MPPLDAAEVPHTGGRLPGIEGLRAVAAGTVLVHHVWLYDGEFGPAGPLAEAILANLALGVTLFFALSGFLLYRPFAAAVARAGDRPGIGGYLRNRGLRILPAYVVIVLVTGLVLQTTNVRTADGALATGALDDPLDLVASLLVVQNYAPGGVLVGVGPAWSLAVEIVFYLLLPLLVLAAAALAHRAGERAGRVRVLLGPPLVLLLVGLSGRFFLGVVLGGEPETGWEADWYSVVQRSFWPQADLFAFGMAAAVLHTEVVDGRVSLPRGWRAGAIAGALAIAVASAATLGDAQLNYPLQNTAVALAAALLVAAVCFPHAGGRPPVLQRVLEARPFVVAGLVSYSVFLWHEPLVHWLTGHDVMRPGQAGFLWNVAVTAASVGVLSLLTYRFVELPALRRKRRDETSS